MEDILALDSALRRNDSDWFERLPPNIEQHVIHKLYYGHFFCHVFHQDYIVRKGVDPIALERQMLHLLEQRGAEYPAEHNVGHGLAGSGPIPIRSAHGAMRSHYDRLQFLFRKEEGPEAARLGSAPTLIKASEVG